MSKRKHQEHTAAAGCSKTPRQVTQASELWAWVVITRPHKNDARTAGTAETQTSAWHTPVLRQAAPGAYLRPPLPFFLPPPPLPPLVGDDAGALPPPAPPRGSGEPAAPPLPAAAGAGAGAGAAAAEDA